MTMSPKHAVKLANIEENKMSNEPATANHRSFGMVLDQLDGTGYLHCQHGTTWICTFSIMRLLNGRLQVTVIPEIKYGTSQKWNDWLRRCEPFKVEGMDDRGRTVSATDIHFTRIRFNHHNALIGYAQSATYCLQQKSNNQILMQSQLSVN